MPCRRTFRGSNEHQGRVVAGRQAPPGRGGRCGQHAAALLPLALRWPCSPTGASVRHRGRLRQERQHLLGGGSSSRTLLPHEGWADRMHEFADAPAARYKPHACSLLKLSSVPCAALQTAYSFHCTFHASFPLSCNGGSAMAQAEPVRGAAVNL